MKTNGLPDLVAPGEWLGYIRWRWLEEGAEPSEPFHSRGCLVEERGAEPFLKSKYTHKIQNCPAKKMSGFTRSRFFHHSFVSTSPCPHLAHAPTPAQAHAHLVPTTACQRLSTPDEGLVVELSGEAQHASQ
jgi:hypothetical protein